MEPIVAILFMSGIILAITGAGRASAILRVGRGVVADDRGGSQPIPLRQRSEITALLWLAVSLYGLLLASAGVIAGR